MTIPLGEPTKIGDRDVRLGFWGMPRNAGDPRICGGTFTLIDGEGDVLLDVFIGPKGDPGENAPVMDWQYDSTVTNIGDLPDVNTLDETDNGRGWLIGTTWYIYVDEAGVSGEYRAVDAGIPGPRGFTPNISASAEIVAAADPDDTVGEIDVVESGALLTPHYHFKIPGLRGPQGPSTTIRLAPDYYNVTPPQDGQGVVWDEGLDKWRPGDLSPTAATMHTIPQGNFVAYSGSAGRQLIASLDLDALPYAWYPDLSGSVKISRSIFASAAVEVEIRIGDTGVGTGETAPLCGLGPYDPQWALLDATALANIRPQFSDTLDPIRAVSPDTSAGRVPAGQAKTLYVFLHKVGGSGTYSFNPDMASQVRLLQFPVS